MQAVTNGDELLDALAPIAPENRSMALAAYSVRLLREAADLCGVSDAGTLGKRSAINAILANF